MSAICSVHLLSQSFSTCFVSFHFSLFTSTFLTMFCKLFRKYSASKCVRRTVRILLNSARRFRSKMNNGWKSGVTFVTLCDDSGQLDRWSVNRIVFKLLSAVRDRLFSVSASATHTTESTRDRLDAGRRRRSCRCGCWCCWRQPRRRRRCCFYRASVICIHVMLLLLRLYAAQLSGDARQATLAFDDDVSCSQRLRGPRRMPPPRPPWSLHDARTCTTICI